MIKSYGTVLELDNECDVPEEGFILSAEDILDHVLAEDTVATWHTHPGATSVLSMGDADAFTNYPHLIHYVVGEDGVQAYKVDADGAVIKCESNSTGD